MWILFDPYIPYSPNEETLDSFGPKDPPRYLDKTFKECGATSKDRTIQKEDIVVVRSTICRRPNVDWISPGSPKSVRTKLSHLREKPNSIKICTRWTSPSVTGSIFNIMSKFYIFMRTRRKVWTRKVYLPVPTSSQTHLFPTWLSIIEFYGTKVPAPPCGYWEVDLSTLENMIVRHVSPPPLVLTTETTVTNRFVSIYGLSQLTILTVILDKDPKVKRVHDTFVFLRTLVPTSTIRRHELW